uniref:RING-type E3 ubiquitin transferase n=1 Tax=Solanum tuberosum TaxID=4113 RepID=M1CQI5_SOLTU
MDEVKKSEGHMTSPAAFVEGGIQDACDDACSICLEAFCESDPPSVTSCKHEFHLQCVLEWYVSVKILSLLSSLISRISICYSDFC